MQLEKMILGGVQRKVKSNFALAQDPVLISTNDRWRLADRFKDQRDNKESIKLPQAFLRLTSLKLDTDSYNPAVLLRHGLYAPAKAGDDVVRKYHVIPAIYSFEFIHISEDFYDMLGFSKRYILATRNRSGLNFNLSFDGIPIDIQVNVDDEVSVPEKDNQLDVPNVYELTANFYVRGYCGFDVEEAKEIDVITSLESSVKVEP